MELAEQLRTDAKFARLFLYDRIVSEEDIGPTALKCFIFVIRAPHDKVEKCSEMCWGRDAYLAASDSVYVISERIVDRVQLVPATIGELTVHC